MGKRIVVNVYRRDTHCEYWAYSVLCDSRQEAERRGLLALDHCGATKIVHRFGI